MISEDWSNDSENSALHHRNKLHLIIYSHKKHLSQFYSFYSVFDQIHAAFVSRKGFLTLNLTNHKHCMYLFILQVKICFHESTPSALKMSGLK